MAHIKEGELLAQLTGDGTIDGSSATLEELALAPGGREILKSVSENWPDIASRFVEKGE